MALIKCKECEKEISSDAVNCPSCGAPVKPIKKKGGFLNFLKKMVITWLVIAAVFYAGFLYVKGAVQEKVEADKAEKAQVKAEKVQAKAQAKAKEEEENKKKLEALARYKKLPIKEKFATPEIGMAAEVADSFDYKEVKAGYGFRGWEIIYWYNPNRSIDTYKDNDEKAKIKAVQISNVEWEMDLTRSIVYTNLIDPNPRTQAAKAEEGTPRINEQVIMELYSDQGLEVRSVYVEGDSMSDPPDAVSNFSAGGVAMSFGCKAYYTKSSSRGRDYASAHKELNSNQRIKTINQMHANRFIFVKGENKDAKACTLVVMKLHDVSRSRALRRWPFVDDPSRYQVTIIKLDPKLPRLNKYWAGHGLD